MTRRLSKTRFWVGLSGVLVLATAAGFAHHATRPQRFIHHWSEEFQRIDSLAAAHALANAPRVRVHELPSGEWLIATCEHGCCSGAGFNATIIRDSTGAMHIDTRRTYCGVTDLEFTLAQAKATHLKDLYPELERER